MVSILYPFYPNLMIVGKARKAMYRLLTHIYFMETSNILCVNPNTTCMLNLQDALARNKKIANPQSTGVVLCGQKQMAEVSSSY